jgi:hypothetical protein
MKRVSKYATMTASDLARVTRERGLEKPTVLHISEWADWLEEIDQQTDAAPVVESQVAAVENAAPALALQAQYDAMSKDNAVKAAHHAGMPTTNRTTKAEAIDFLLAAAAVSEDEQQAADDDAETGDEEEGG